jgi:hypothetical protein
MGVSLARDWQTSWCWYTPRCTLQSFISYLTFQAPFGPVCAALNPYAFLFDNIRPSFLPQLISTVSPHVWAFRSILGTVWIPLTYPSTADKMFENNNLHVLYHLRLRIGIFVHV